MTRITGTAGPSKAGNRTKDGSDFDGHNVDKNSDLSNVCGLSEIEQLLKGKKFSRQVMHLLFLSVLLRCNGHATFMPYMTLVM